MTTALKENLKATSETISDLANALETYNWDETNLTVNEANKALIEKARYIAGRLDDEILDLATRGY